MQKKIDYSIQSNNSPKINTVTRDQKYFSENHTFVKYVLEFSQMLTIKWVDMKIKKVSMFAGNQNTPLMVNYSTFNTKTNLLNYSFTYS